MIGLAEYAWRLIPANPILLRVVETAGRRRRDLFIRCGYLGLLITVVVFSLIGGGAGSGSSLSDLAKTSAVLFQRMSYLQLGLVALLAPIFTASAITQEKDSQTYDILLTTPLTNGQVVLGSLLSRLFFVVALLVSGIPIFSITQIFGGVAISAIVRSFFIAAATAFVTGALATAIAVFKVGTRRTIFSFYLFVVVYLVGLFVLDQVPYFQIPGHQTNTQTPCHISWFTGLQPFLALRATFHDPAYNPPLLGNLPPSQQAWPVGWYLSDPAGFYTTVMFFLSFVLVTPSIVLLRRLAQSTTSPKTWLLQKFRLSRGDRTRKPRVVWNNPIAWREARTKASAFRASMLRYSFIALGLAGALVLVYFFASIEAPKSTQYIDTQSVDLNHQLLTVYTFDGTATTLPIQPYTSYLLNGKESTLDALRGKLSVVAVPNNDKANPGWTSITASDLPRMLSADNARKYLLGVVTIEFAVILLIVTNAAASTVTREKEDGTLDLLLSTPITSRYYIWGKLRGLVSFVLPLVAVPVLSATFFVVYDLFRHSGNWNDAAFQWIVFPEALLILPATLVIVSAFAAIVGMQMSLRCRKTVVAVMSGVGIVVGLCTVLGFCGFNLLQSSNASGIGPVIGSFSPFTVMTMEIDPYEFAEGAFPRTEPETLAWARIWVFVVSFVAVAAYTGLVAAMYRSMVKNFDMTIRRQQR